MPRKSAASLSVVRPDLGRRPPPPATLSDRQKALWTAITSAKPADWFGLDSLPLLAALCAHAETFELLQREFAVIDAVDTADKLNWLEKLTRLRERESRAMASLSTKLRLTNQSRYTPKAGATAAGQHRGPRPWDWPNEFARNGNRPPK